jgi:DNA-binding NtrC family response regulator
MPIDSKSSTTVLEGKAGDDLTLPGVIGCSQGLYEVIRITRQVAPTRACVLIVGETGTGKELIARAIHDLSPRSTGPYIRVNCGALTESLLESELFGHVKGSFTGAVDNRTGRFEAAHTGSIFLDEINSTSPKLQVKLLRVLQEGEFERVGDNNTKKVDTRIIAATNRDLLEEIEANQFREDLYYRLNVVPIYLPPLRERREDVEPLVLTFLRRYTDQNRREMRRVHPEAMRLLSEHDWPGNVRELQNYVERAAILGTGPELLVEHLPPQLRGQTAPRPARPRSVSDQGVLCSELVRQGISTAGPNANNLYDRIVGRIERELIKQVLHTCDRVQIKAAARLGINRNTLHKKLAEYRLDEVDGSPPDVPNSPSPRRGSSTSISDPDEHLLDRASDLSEPAGQPVADHTVGANVTNRS